MVESEYDVQYLLRSILHLFFDNIRPEEPGKTQAGSSSKADFLLFNEKIIVECKYITKSLTRKKLKMQLNNDIGDYQPQEDCDTLVFFIYDPYNLLENPRGFETDFNKRANEPFEIRTFIRPTGH